MTHYGRDEAHLSPELELMHMNEHRPELAAPGRAGVGADDTTVTEWVEPSLFAAAGDWCEADIFRRARIKFFSMNQRFVNFSLDMCVKGWFFLQFLFLVF